MLLIHCPYCEEARPELEFRHAGEAHIARPAGIAEISDEAFEAYFFIRDNTKGIVFERWRHIHGCGRFFNAARHSVSDRFVVTYRAGEPKPELSGEQVAAAAPGGKATPANAAAGVNGKAAR
ncbi:MAG: sarcosine oxidase subunit delta [Alphaproteobacteria bacterium]|nr:MAG: sarcosine oxidase subunit delta [Alphaproteobacteria bacterium]